MKVDYRKSGKYRTGDKVIIVAPKNKDSTDGEYKWIPRMDNFVGKELTVIRVGDDYYLLKGGDGWHWDEPWLIPAEPESQLDIPDLSVLGL